MILPIQKGIRVSILGSAVPSVFLVVAIHGFIRVASFVPSDTSSNAVDLGHDHDHDHDYKHDLDHAPPGLTIVAAVRVASELGQRPFSFSPPPPKTLAAMLTMLRSLGIGRPQERRGAVPLPLYSPVAFSEASTDYRQPSDDLDLSLDEIQNDQLRPAQRHGTAAERSASIFALPSLPRFLADFTLGFADGLTVPFALTAGLSSLGQTDTVIYAGMAEICAGSISMGIGGYLAAKGENAAARRNEKTEPTNEDTEDTEKGGASEKELADVAAKYLAPLSLPPHLLDMVAAHVRDTPDVIKAIEANTAEDDEESRLCSPIMVGLSVSLGYLLGGLLPLFPYFLVSKVEDALIWSFVVCVIALFIFGFTKDFLLTPETSAWERLRAAKTLRKIPWRDIRRSTWEGLQMVILGSVAALAAVLCVRLFEGMSASTTTAPGAS